MQFMRRGTREARDAVLKLAASFAPVFLSCCLSVFFTKCLLLLARLRSWGTCLARLPLRRQALCLCHVWLFLAQFRLCGIYLVPAVTGKRYYLSHPCVDSVTQHTQLPCASLRRLCKLPLRFTSSQRAFSLLVSTPAGRARTARSLTAPYLVDSLLTLPSAAAWSSRAGRGASQTCALVSV